MSGRSMMLWRHDVLSVFRLWPFLFLVLGVYSLPDGDLCKWMNGRKYYIDSGESGIISVENVTSQTKGEANSNSQPQIPQRCSVELITCPSCHFEVSVLYLNIPACSSDGSCRCDFVWIKESAYSKSGQEYCGFVTKNSSNYLYESKTKLVSVDFLYSGSYKDAFALQFTAKKNIYYFKGGPDYYQTNSTGFIQSPNFPGGYPSDYSAEYILQNLEASGFVQLLFTDFQLSVWSYMEIFDTNGSRIDVFNGNTFRPPAIISSGSLMTVKFQANDEYPSTGFKAQFVFVGYPEKYWANRPSTDCGGFVEDYGGAITMMNMVPSNTLRTFDCIWLVRPRNGHIPETQISIRVAQFEEMGSKSTLSIRQGLHSEAPLLQSVTTFQHHKMPRGQEFVAPATVGFYIRLIGYFNNKSHLAIIYTTFRYEGCYAIGDFECANGRCIKSGLQCDGFNHCGDGTDEAACYGSNQGTQSPEDTNWWRTLTPNYYFPKSESTTNPGTNTLILVTSLAGLGMFVLTTVMILVKLHRQRQDDGITREILHTVSADVDSENSPDHRIRSDPPLYDPPPTYEDVIKFYLPPPPAYSSIGRGQGTCYRLEPSGLDNASFIPESPEGIRPTTRSSPPISSTAVAQTRLEPFVLRVMLPDDQSLQTLPTSNLNRNTYGDNNTYTSQISSSTSQPNADQISHINSNVVECSVASNTQDLTSPHPKQCDSLAEIESANNSNYHSKSSPKVKAGTSKQTLSPTTYVQRKCKDIVKHQSLTNNSQQKDLKSCECYSACLCSMKDDKNYKSDMSFGDALTSVKNPVLKHKPTSKIPPSLKCSFTGSGIKIPHPESMIITLSSKSKSRNRHNKNGSHSAGPSSPTNFEAIDMPCGRANEITVPFRLCHHRSSSGPSEISDFFISHFKYQNEQQKNIEHKPSKSDTPERAISKSHLTDDLSNLNNVKHLATAIFDGFHQSFSLKNSLADHEIDCAIAKSLQGNGSESASSKNILPSSWSLLWNPVKKSPEKTESCSRETERLWVSSDTQPLLRKISSQPGLLSSEDKKVSQKNEIVGTAQTISNSQLGTIRKN